MCLPRKAVSMTQAQKTASGGDLPYQIVDAVAERHGVAPQEIEGELHTRIDTDSLERLWTEPPQVSFGVVSFYFSGCRVTVTEDGDVEATLVG